MTSRHRDESCSRGRPGRTRRVRRTSPRTSRPTANPQRMATEVARVVAEQLRARRIQWVVIDDYHEISAEDRRRALRRGVEQELDCRFLIASRLRPGWATARLAVYGDVVEIDRRDLSMSREESRRVLGAHPDFEHVVAQAEGWPAVIGLAASARGVRIPGSAALVEPPAHLFHRRAIQDRGTTDPAPTDAACARS